MDDLARRPMHALFGIGSVAAGFLLVQHGVEDRDDPVFEEAVVVVGHDEVADAVLAFGAEIGARCAEGSEVGRRETFYEVFFDAAGGGDDGGYVCVLG